MRNLTSELILRCLDVAVGALRVPRCGRRDNTFTVH